MGLKEDCYETENLSHISAPKYVAMTKISASYPNCDRQYRSMLQIFLSAWLACHSGDRESKFLSQLHTYGHLCVTNFQPRSNPPSIPFLL